MLHGVQLHIMHKPAAENDSGPQIALGFANETFSQCVFLDAPMDAGKAVEVADALYKGYLEACGAAVKAWKESHPEASDADKS